MKDRFLSRGKRIDNGEWVCGNYVHTRKDDYFIYDHDYGVNVDVNPDTVCQCTGITDKNNRLIFEGDIVEFIVEFDVDNKIYVVKWWDGCMAMETYSSRHILQLQSIYTKRLKVIGNIYDNPELKEGRAK